MVDIRERLARGLTGWAQRLRGDREIPGDDDGNTPALQTDTIVYLSELAAESFKRQTDIDESIWRSLPFFAATLGLAATILGAAAQTVPRFGASAAAMALNAMLIVATASFAWAVRWFWAVVKPRDYEYPSADADVRDYAAAITAYHAANGLQDADLDARVVTDLRLLIMEQFGTAARTNFTHNATKMKARGRVLLFLMTGFVLAFACEAIIFVTCTFEIEIARGETRRDDPKTVTTRTAIPTARPAPDAAPPPAGDGRRTILGLQRQAGHSGEALMAKPPTPPRPPAAQKPTPPSMQSLTKFRHRLDYSQHSIDLSEAPTPPSEPNDDNKDE